MKERLVIKNFGPIKSVDLELGKMTILIGEQATGKSTIAKVLAVCRYFSFITRIEESVINSSFSNGLRSWGLYGMADTDSLIEYYSDDYELIVKDQRRTIRLLHDEGDKHKTILVFTPLLTAKSKRFKNLLENLDSIKSQETNYIIPPSFYQNNVMEVMDNPFFFPTERGLQSIFSLGKNSIQNLSDSLFNQFARLDQILKNYNQETEIKPLNIYYKTDQGEGFTRKKNEDIYYSLKNGASGYQSVIPIFLAIKFYNEVQKRSRTFIVEEPELNLFPKAQKSLMEFFVESINTFDNKFLLPTHSPYVLSSLNNLVYAYTIGHLENGIFKEQVKEIIPEKYWLNPQDIAVYYLENGEAKDIFDKEENLINTDYIDSVSTVINDEFDRLLSIEVKHNNNSTI